MELYLAGATTVTGEYTTDRPTERVTKDTVEDNYKTMAGSSGNLGVR